MKTAARQLSDEIKNLGLERYVLELETDGLTIVPPEVTGVTPDMLDRQTEVLLNRFTEMTGCPISVEKGPEGKLVWPERKNPPKESSNMPDPTQLIIQQLLQLDRCFRDLFVNPVVDELVSYMFGEGVRGNMGKKARRLSSTNSFVKWQGDSGYGEHLGLHCDQGAIPLPWGSTALTGNATWCLTDYSLDDGALAWVPGSHRANGRPVQSMAAKRAVPAECPRGSVIIWPGTTWHGAYPRKTPGLRLNAVAYYRHYAVLPQENLRVTMQDQPWDDCNDPVMMRELIGFDENFPYLTQIQAVPRLAKSA